MFKGILITIIVVANVARFVGLGHIPKGFYVDEAAGAANVLCLVEQGKDIYGVEYPLFPRGNVGTYDPIYIYTAYALVKMFGNDLWVFRFVPALYHCAAVLGLGMLAYLLGGGLLGLLVLTLASLSPWCFQLSRVAWGSALPNFFVVLGMCCFFLTDWRTWRTSWQRYGLWALTGAFFAMGMYCYQAARLLIPVMILTLVLLRGRKNWDLRGYSVMVFTLLALLPPLIHFQFFGGENRSSAVGLFSTWYISYKFAGSYLAAIPVFFDQIWEHFKPSYILFLGDANQRHSPGIGIASWPECLGLVVVIMTTLRLGWRCWEKHQQKILLMSLIGILAGVLPAALTNEGIPHGLRSFGAWPFMVLLAGLGLHKLCQMTRYGRTLILGMCSVFFVFFLYHYFVIYPQSNSGFFHRSPEKHIVNAVQQGDWHLYFDKEGAIHSLDANQFYLMKYAGLSCSEARKICDEFYRSP